VDEQPATAKERPATSTSDSLATPAARGDDGMQRNEDPTFGEAITDIATLLAAAYLRRARAASIRPMPASLLSTNGLDKAAGQSLHEVTLTPERKESLGS
jgi:hypothetical protein